MIFRFRDIMQAVLSDFDEMLNRIGGRTGDTLLSDVVSEIMTLCVGSTWEYDSHEQDICNDIVV